MIKLAIFLIGLILVWLGGQLNGLSQTKPKIDKATKRLKQLQEFEKIHKEDTNEES